MQQQQEKYNIIHLKDSRREPYTLRMLSSCCYKRLKPAVIWFLQIVEVLNSIELLL